MPRTGCLRDPVGEAGRSLAVDPQDLAEPGRRDSGRCWAVAAAAAVADRDVQQPVEAEGEHPAVVVVFTRWPTRRSRRNEPGEACSVVEVALYSARMTSPVPARCRARRTCGCACSRGEGQGEQAALAVEHDLRAHVEERRRQDVSGPPDLDDAALLDDEQPARSVAGVRDLDGPDRPLMTERSPIATFEKAAGVATVGAVVAAGIASTARAGAGRGRGRIASPVWLAAASGCAAPSPSAAPAGAPSRVPRTSVAAADARIRRWANGDMAPSSRGWSKDDTPRRIARSIASSVALRGRGTMEPPLPL